MKAPRFQRSTRALASLVLAAFGCDDMADSEVAPTYSVPVPSYPARDDAGSFALSEVGLFDGDRVAPDLIAFEPRWALWSDGLAKRRWLRLPADGLIDNSDPDHWQLPVGAVLFKEFAAGERRLETRVIARTGPGDFDYWMGAFIWRADGSDADFVRDGVLDVAGTDHDVPSAERCWSCHVGAPGRVLGLSTVQLSGADAATLAQLTRKLSSATAAASVGVIEARARAALGYLHANCAHCHSPTGAARPDTDLDLELSFSDASLEHTGAWQTGVSVATRSWIRPDYPLRIAPGDPARSALVARMRTRGDADQMPPLASKHVDERGLAIVSDWITSLGP